MLKLYDSIVSVGVDYVTASCNEKSAASRIRVFAETWLGAEHSAGNELREWSSFGYTGLSAGAVTFGVRPDSCLVRVTGSMAQSKAQTILRFATNCSRIDFQTTVRLKCRTYKLAERTERVARRFQQRRGRRSGVRLVRDSLSGNTTYIGRRVSERFIRVYDKGAESRLPELEGCWRAEVQFNKDLAWTRAKQLRSKQCSVEWVSAIVELEMARQGIAWPALFPTEQQLAQLVSEPKSRTTADRKMKWLREQVGPTCRDLLKWVSREEIVDALGLSGPKE